MSTDDIAVISSDSLWQWIARLRALQLAEPNVFHVQQVNDLLSDGAVRIIYFLVELLKGQRSDVLQNLAVLGEVIVIKMTKGLNVHGNLLSAQIEISITNRPETKNNI